jgi:hypothetical protein
MCAASLAPPGVAGLAIQRRDQDRPSAAHRGAGIRHVAEAGSAAYQSLVLEQPQGLRDGVPGMPGMVAELLDRGEQFVRPECAVFDPCLYVIHGADIPARVFHFVVMLRSIHSRFPEHRGKSRMWGFFRHG